MMQKWFVPALAAALLAGCNGQVGSNEAVDANNVAEPLESAASNALENTGEVAGNETPEGGETGDLPEPVTNTAPPPEPSAAKRPTSRPPQPTAEPDPHAGHDTGNMANHH